MWMKQMGNSPRSALAAFALGRFIGTADTPEALDYLLRLIGSMRKLRSRGLTFGILVTTRGITGQAANLTAAPARRPKPKPM